MPALAEILINQWNGIRRLTYDYLDILDEAHLAQKLPFPTSKSLGYQFWCMAGAHESYLKKLQYGTWQGFSSSLDQLPRITPASIKQQMQLADARMAELCASIDLEAELPGGYQHAYDVLFQMIKHEMHHHGQLINFMYYLRLPIPPSWQREWALAYDE